MAQENVVSWFEIPVKDMDRAMRFYETIFGQHLVRHTFGKTLMAWFPAEQLALGSSGSLVYNPEFYTPGSEGPLIYFNTPTGDMEIDLARIEKSGGKIIIKKTQISEDKGYMSVFNDTEGNRLALHSQT